MLTLHYHSKWQDVFYYRTPQEGNIIRMAVDYHETEMRDFQRCLKNCGLELSFMKLMPKSKLNVYQLIKIQK